MAQREGLTSKIFGSWKVLGPAEGYKWLCECMPVKNKMKSTGIIKV